MDSEYCLSLHALDDLGAHDSKSMRLRNLSPNEECATTLRWEICRVRHVVFIPTILALIMSEHECEVAALAILSTGVELRTANNNQMTHIKVWESPWIAFECGPPKTSFPETFLRLKLN